MARRVITITRRLAVNCVRNSKALHGQTRLHLNHILDIRPFVRATLNYFGLPSPRKRLAVPTQTTSDYPDHKVARRLRFSLANFQGEASEESSVRITFRTTPRWDIS